MAKSRSLNKLPEHLVQLITRRSTGSGRRKDSWRRAKRNGFEQDMTTSRTNHIYIDIYIYRRRRRVTSTSSPHKYRESVKLCNASFLKTEHRFSWYPAILIRTFVGRRLHNCILFIAVSSNVEIEYLSRSRVRTKTTTDEWTLPNLSFEN